MLDPLKVRPKPPEKMPSQKDKLLFLVRDFLR